MQMVDIFRTSIVEREGKKRKPRQISETNTRNNGPRGRGRGRGGCYTRGGGGGRGRGDRGGGQQGMILNGVDVSDPTRNFTSDKYSKLGKTVIGMST